MKYTMVLSCVCSFNIQFNSQFNKMPLVLWDIKTCLYSPRWNVYCKCFFTHPCWCDSKRQLDEQKCNPESHSFYATALYSKLILVVLDTPLNPFFSTMSPQNVPLAYHTNTNKITTYNLTDSVTGASMLNSWVLGGWHWAMGSLLI